MNRTAKRLDETDRKLVTLLRRDARRTTASLARALNLSRTAVQARMSRLERDGIILGYTASIASDAVGNTLALVTLTIGVRPCALVVDQLVAWPEVERLYSVAGERDAVLVVSAASPQGLSDLADRLQAIDGVSRVETTVILSQHSTLNEVTA